MNDEEFQELLSKFETPEEPSLPVKVEEVVKSSKRTPKKKKLDIVEKAIKSINKKKVVDRRLIVHIIKTLEIEDNRQIRKTLSKFLSTLKNGDGSSIGHGRESHGKSRTQHNIDSDIIRSKPSSRHTTSNNRPNKKIHHRSLQRSSKS